MFIISISVGQESGYSLPRCWALPRVSHKAAIKVPARGCSHLKAQVQANLLPSSFICPFVDLKSSLAVDTLVLPHKEVIFVPHFHHDSWLEFWQLDERLHLGLPSWALNFSTFLSLYPCSQTGCMAQGVPTSWVHSLKLSKGPGASRNWQNHLSNLLSMPKWVPWPMNPKHKVDQRPRGALNYVPIGSPQNLVKIPCKRQPSEQFQLADTVFLWWDYGRLGT